MPPKVLDDEEAFALNEALEKEARLEKEANHLLAERARIKEDREFLRSFAHAAENNATNRYYDAEVAVKELQHQISETRRTQEFLHQAHQELASLQAALRQHSAQRAHMEEVTQNVERRIDAELSHLHHIYDIEAHSHQQAAQKSAHLTQLLQAERFELAEQVRYVQMHKRQSDEAKSNLAQVRDDAAKRVAMEQDVLVGTLQRLEADFAQERAEREARETHLKKHMQSPSTTAAPTPQMEAASKQAAATLLEDEQDLFTSQAVEKPTIGPSPSALERQVMELRRRRELTEALWPDSALKDRGRLVEEHLAALAARAPCSSQRSASASSDADVTGSPERNRIRVANGLIYV